METIMRNAFLFLSKNRLANRTAKKYGLRFGAKRFVAGEQISEAITTVKQLNDRGIVATLDHLGEFISTKEEAAESAQYCIRTLNEIAAHQVTSNLSVKLTQLGLDISPELCLDHMRAILDTAQRHNNFVRIDMEDYGHNEATIEMFNTLREEFGSTVGLVIQAYLYKSSEDIDQLNRYKPNLRLVKGAYKESPQVAYPDKVDVDRNFTHIIEQHLANGNYAAIATHDDHIIEHVKQIVRTHNIPRTQFEFQMLYGIRNQAQQQLADEGYTMRVYVPYGNDWYGYFMRRLAERPANVGFVLKSMFKA
ncbi:proline dehydrogenase family protein [Paenibacillus alvei]|uniref:proline dehydrogenase n=1 Tax=Paenibacillus alvei TaxID=44250 RepID=A0AAP6ZUD9_PAEAL|nr:proline dehydrogenase [Paenibacillus alvei]MBG9733662.1 proline dehydrogenase [Paenibacillus alvei]MBG9745795.1 proline dehydrogenase [Paenibacillus alvei]MCY9580363.1 proline dehydrogenase [Paenibacillus alvei]MCY9583311.1 proline dehydrogenase [Paenibacillus alvei]NEZ41738.1 proline dehydrogenase [Paenibacillus alvei]